MVTRWKYSIRNRNKTKMTSFNRRIIFLWALDVRRRSNWKSALDNCAFFKMSPSLTWGSRGRVDPWDGRSVLNYWISSRMSLTAELINHLNSSNSGMGYEVVHCPLSHCGTSIRDKEIRASSVITRNQSPLFLWVIINICALINCKKSIYLCQLSWLWFPMGVISYQQFICPKN